MAARRALTARSVHIRIEPRPANLSESREIFRVLQQFGELSTFKSLRVGHPCSRVCQALADLVGVRASKYEYQNPAANIAFAIYRDQASVQKALNASPIRFALEQLVDTTHYDDPSSPLHHEEPDIDDNSSPKPPANKSIDDILRPPQLLNRPRLIVPSESTPDPLPLYPPSSQQPTMPFDPPPSAPRTRTKTSSKWFQVTVDQSHAVHQDHAERQPFWKQFQPMKSMAQEDLAKKVPYHGLSDVSKRPPNAHRTPNWVLKTMNDYVERGMPTLRKMAEDHPTEKTFRERKKI